MHNFLLRRTMVHFLIIYWMLTWAQAHLTVAHTSSPAARLILPTSAASIPSRLHMLPDEVVHSERRGLSADATLLNRWRSAVDGGTSVKQITTLAEPNLSDEPLAAVGWSLVFESGSFSRTGAEKLGAGGEVATSHANIE